MGVLYGFSSIEKSFCKNTDAYKPDEHTLACVREINKNISAPASFLRRLSMSQDPELRIAVADHESTPEEVLLTLAIDDNPDVRYAIAENHNISVKVLYKLCNDTNPYVVDRARRTLARLTDAVCKRESRELRESS